MEIYIGIDIGGTTINLGLVSESEQIVEERVLTTHPERGPADALNRISATLKEMISQWSVGNEIKGAGIGLPGLLDTESGKVVETSNLPGWDNFPIVRELTNRLELPVFIENDADLAAYGEQWMGAGKDCQNLFMITLGSGIGGALIVKNKILKLHPSSGEFGHMIIEKNGVVCSCGRRGCLETFVSKHGFKRLVMERLPAEPFSALRNFEAEAITPQIIAMAASQGDILAKKVYAEAGSALGIAIGNVVNLVGVSRIIIGGGISNSWDLLREPLMNSLETTVFKMIYKNVKVSRAKLGEKAGFVGAAKLAYNKINDLVTTA